VVAGEQIDRQQPAPLQFVQHGEERIAVLAARKADEPFRPLLDHAVLLDRLAHLADDALAQLAELGADGGTVKERMNVVGRIGHAPRFTACGGAGQGARCCPAS
jgi:hypothetical protein